MDRSRTWPMLAALALLARPAAADDPVRVHCEGERCTAAVPEDRASLVLDVREVVPPASKTIDLTDTGGRAVLRLTSCADGVEACIPARDAAEWKVKLAGGVVRIQRRNALPRIAAPGSAPGPAVSSIATFVTRDPPAAPVDARTASIGGQPIAPAQPGQPPGIEPDDRQGVLPTGQRIEPLRLPAPGASELKADPSGIDRVAGIGGATTITRLPAAAPGGIPVDAPRQRPPAAKADDETFADVVLVAGDQPRCTGVLVRPRLVLTAGHCLPAAEVQFASRADAVVERARVVREVAHPDGLDAAALVLDRDAPWAPRPMRTARDAAPPVGSLAIIGFGIDDPVRRRGFGVKRRIAVNVGGWGCDLHRARATGCDPETELLVPPESGRDTCDGDSGGPVLEWAGGTWRLIAITSRPTVVTRTACGRGGIYVRTDALGAWLESIASSTRGGGT